MKFLLLLMLALAASLAPAAADQPLPPIAAVSRADLPREARETLLRIEHGGPFPFRRDGAIFGNREHRLPPKPHGAYREYTVPTPGSGGRGARRIVAAQGAELYYSEDHYRSFRRIGE